MLMQSLIRKVVGSRNERLLKKLKKTVVHINGHESLIRALPDDQLKAKTLEFKQRLKDGETLEHLLPEAFAVVREAARRSLNMRHFDVQLIGGMALHYGKIAEMRTGEGKTLAATLPAYLNALLEKGVHIVTVNDYLAKRDAEWMSPVYDFLGLTVGVIVHNLTRPERQDAYAADITYGTNNEFGFDYLRDNMAFSAVERVQRGLQYAIVDEVDSILIDEARTPLIISGSDEDSSELYITMNRLVAFLKPELEKDGPGDYKLDEKARQAYLTEEGHLTVERLLAREGLLQPGDSLYDPAHVHLMHHVYAAMRAHAIFKCDVDYIVADNQVVIVDEHTGRTMPGRRWSDGLHQAVEAKEGVEIQSENQTLASITFQNYFRLYQKLAGMTGTADTEAYEFQQIYGLEVVVIPTHRKNNRNDYPDLIYLTIDEKFDAILKDIQSCVSRKQPVLVGTISIETSEFLSKLLKKRNIPHQVLNAKYHEKEAEIIAEAGRPGTVTIATNMAGRGTDIVLGGSKSPENEEDWKKRHDAVVKSGGLHIIGTERHESRRIDNQLRGRAGRQGDPGSTRFYLSVKDNLMRIFISESISALLSKLGMQHGESISHPWVNRAIENAQRKVEGHNFDIRKQLLEFDDVANDQRKVVYRQRNELMEISDISENIQAIRLDILDVVMEEYVPQDGVEDEWNIEGLTQLLAQEFGIRLDIKHWLAEDENLQAETLKLRILTEMERVYSEKEASIGFEAMRHLEKAVMLNVLDSNWKDHLATMDYMRQSIHLRGYAQKDPKQEYKREAFTLFGSMLDSIKRNVIALLSVVQVQDNTAAENLDEQLRRQEPQNLAFQHDSVSALSTDKAAAPAEIRKSRPQLRSVTKVGRNDPCPCGSGKKYKQCHGQLAVIPENPDNDAE